MLQDDQVLVNLSLKLRRTRSKAGLRRIGLLASVVSKRSLP